MAEEGQDGQTPTTTTDEDEAWRLPSAAASGLLAFTAPGGCELRAIDIRSGRMLDLPRLETSCELYAPRVGNRVAYRTLDYEGGSRTHFSILDLEHPRASFGEYEGFPIAWGPDGSTLAWCDSDRSGFELSRGQRPKRRDHCPRAYDPSGVTASVNDRQEIVIGGRPLLRARGPVWHLAWGVDGSLAVLVEGGRVDRYEGGRLVGAASVPTLTPDRTITFLAYALADLAPDNCAALSVSGDVVRLIDLGCFQGRAPQTFKGLYADWSPNGKWTPSRSPTRLSSTGSSAARRRCAGTWSRGSSPGSAVDRGRPPDLAPSPMIGPLRSPNGPLFHAPRDRMERGLAI